MSKVSINENEFKKLLHANCYYDRHEIDWYDRFAKFGYFDPYNTMTGSREYFFITKPDLHIFKEGNTSSLNPQIANSTFFNDTKNRYLDVLKQLQISAMNNNSPFINLIFNSMKNSVDMPSISAPDIEGSSTIYGDNIPYRGSSIVSNNNHEFTLELQDTRYLEVYMLLRIWDEYFKKKVMGSITPPNISYTENKKLHDQCSAYKIIVAEDGETIIYFAKFWGVYPKGVPRDTFSDIKDGNIIHSTTWNATFVEDMDPLILDEFNEVVRKYMSSYSNSEIYDSANGHMNGKWAKIPYITYNKKGGYIETMPSYKLKWRE